MFETLEKDIKNTCYDHCRWFKTNACPYNDKFPGRRLFDTEQQSLAICHRFVLKPAERERRWKKLMDKLHENLGIGPDDNYPF
jgi:hypothetical protein